MVLLFGGGDDGFEAIELLGRKLGGIRIHQRRDGAREGAVEKRLHHSLQRGAARLRPRLGRQIDLAGAFLAVPITSGLIIAFSAFESTRRFAVLLTNED